MPFSRKLILLTALMVGLGFVGSGEVHAAALVNKVEITTPDSGALLGIDDKFQVRVEVEDFLERTDLVVTIFLAAEKKVGDATRYLLFGDDEDQVLDATRNETQIQGLTQVSARVEVDGDDITQPTDGYVGVSVSRRIRGKGKVIVDRAAVPTATPPIAQEAVDGDSLVLHSVSNEDAVYIWYGSVHWSALKDAKIRAGAYVTDLGDNNANSDIVYSKSAIDIDAVRTASPANFQIQRPGTLNDGTTAFVLTPGATRNSFIGEEILVEPTPATPNDPNDDKASGKYRDIKGSLTKVSRVGDATNNTDHIVLNTGDTLSLEIKLGDANALRGTEDYDKVVLDIAGKERLVYQRGNTPRATTRSSDTLYYEMIIADGDFDDFQETAPYHGGVDADPVANDADYPNAITDTLTVYIVDKAGNRSKANGATTDEDPAGASAVTKLLFDSKGPALDSVSDPAKGLTDTILPVSVDTISDGTRNSDARRIGADDNQITYKLLNTLQSLQIEFDGASKDTFKIAQTGDVLIQGAKGLFRSTEYTVDFTQLGDKDAAAGMDSVWVTSDNDETLVKLATRKDEEIKTGMYSLKFTGTDVAGNTGQALTRENVYVDVDELMFQRSFPFGEGDNESGLDTIEAKTSVVVFRLSEPADSVNIEYKGIDLGSTGTTSDEDSSRGYVLVGGQLANTSIQEFPIPGLVQDNQYVLQVLARDLNGNWSESVADTFWYDTTYAVPQAASIKVEVPDDHDGNGGKVPAGNEVTVTLTAKAITDVDAVTYDQPATLTIGGGTGIKVNTDKSTGATDNGDGTVSLNGEDWVVGKRTVVFVDTVGGENLTISIRSDADSTIVGEADSVTVSIPDEYNQIIVTGPDTVYQGQNFSVDVMLADRFANQRDDSRFLAISADKVGVQVPSDAVYFAKGTGSFQANSSGFSGGDVTFTVREIIDGATKNAKDEVVAGFAHGTATVYVRAEGDAPPPGEAPDAPDQVVAEDYRGASGEGDQGGFVLLTWDASDHHDTLDKYRIYRQIAITTDADSTGALVTLDEPSTALVSWGTIDAIPGADVMRVVVATLDSDAAAFGVAAERNGATGKQAFGAGQNVSNPYELMAQTMSMSKEAAAPVSDQPVFATLTPEALAFQAKGVVPLFKSVENNVLRSQVTLSEVVKSIDNIPPGAIPYLRVLDTPGDAGGSIRVNWTLSPDDRILTSTVGNAVGVNGNVYTIAGVKVYNVYRKIGDAAFELVAQVPAGENSFDDQTVFNGVRYTYQVRPTDVDNETESEFEGTAMAIRNRVLDANGNVVLGLFGSDDQVGFDDFFILADQFGLTVEDENFEPAFDLGPNNKIDLNDFFIFADFFGRTVEGAGKALPLSMAGLNSDARFYLDAGIELPRVGEEMAILVNLQDFVELQGYGLSVSYNPQDLTYVGARVENGILGAGEFAEGQLVSHKDGLLSLAAYGDLATEGDLGLSLVFRSLREIEDSYIDIVDADVIDGSYGLNALATPVSVRIQTRPEVYALRNNFPNPFNPETTLKYDLPDAGDVKLEVYNMLGQVVRTLVNEHQTAGRYAVQWDATNDHGQAMSSGIYFYRVQVEGEFTDVKKMLLLK